ncbi:FeoB-associated Cys-rich membrane protein [Spongiivirga citrea]
MCRAALESSGDNGLAEGINNGIVFLMAIPYILVAVVGYLIYRMVKKSKNNTV